MKKPKKRRFTMEDFMEATIQTRHTLARRPMRIVDPELDLPIKNRSHALEMMLLHIENHQYNKYTRGQQLVHSDEHGFKDMLKKRNKKFWKFYWRIYGFRDFCVKAQLELDFH